MKKASIVLLICIAVCIAVLVSFIGSLTTYDTIRTAKARPGKYLHLIARLDHSRPVEYDPRTNPNYLAFTAIDSLGDNVKVIYHNAKPDNLEVSDRLVLKGVMNEDHFECREILMKCPSKYKDERGMITGGVEPVKQMK